MAYEQESRKLFFTAVGLIICVAGLFAVIGIADRADALPAGSCSSTCVTTLNGLSNIVNIVPFSSLNLTVVGQNINIGLALGHQNYWSAQQTFNANVNFGTTSTIDYLNTCYLQFSTFPTISPCVDDSLQLGGLSHRIYSVVSEDFFVPAIKGDIYGASELSYNGVGGYLSLGALTNSTAQDVMLERNAAKTLSFYTFDSGGSFIQRLQINGGSAQGSAGITTFERIIAGSDNTLEVGDNINRFTNFDASQGFRIWHSSGDSNPTSQLGDGFLKFGAGGASTLNYELSRQRADVLTLQELTSTSNIQFEIMPKSTGRISTFTLWGTDFSVDQTNFQYARLSTDGSNFDIASGCSGTFSCLPIRFLNSGTVNFAVSTTGIGNTQGFQSIINQALTNPSTSTNISLPVTEPDTSYAAVCTGNFSGVLSISGKMTNQFTVNYPAISVGTDKVDCIVTHQ